MADKVKLIDLIDKIEGNCTIKLRDPDNYEIATIRTERFERFKSLISGFDSLVVLSIMVEMSNNMALIIRVGDEENPDSWETEGDDG